MDRKNQDVLIVGAGAMAREYLKVLLHIGFRKDSIKVVGRSREGAEKFKKETGHPCLAGGIERIPDIRFGTSSIIAVTHHELEGCCRGLISKGCRNILLEKPGALLEKDLIKLRGISRKHKARVVLALNRRFYKSVEKAREIIDEDGGLLSCQFDFTEMESGIFDKSGKSSYGETALKRWGIVNSIHVIDLFFHLAGMPGKWSRMDRGRLAWHPSASRFCGSGITEKNVMFSYLSTWDGAGRWGIELTTRKRKMVLRPLELLAVQSRGTFNLVPVDLEKEPTGLKPGFLGEVEKFLRGSGPKKIESPLCGLDEWILHYRAAEAILGYSK